MLLIMLNLPRARTAYPFIVQIKASDMLGIDAMPEGMRV